MRGVARFLTFTVTVTMLVTAGLPVAMSQTGNERMLVRLAKHVAHISSLGAETVLATVSNVNSALISSSNEIALINLTTGELKTLARGQCPSLSPDRTRIAWVTGPRLYGDVTILDLRTQEQRKLTEELPAGCVRWSPDGRRIAVHNRVERAGRVVVISAETGQIEQAISGGQYTLSTPIGTTRTEEVNIGRPAWQADAQRLAFRVSAWEVRSFTIIIIPGREAIAIPNHGDRYVINRIEGFDLRDRQRSQILAISSDVRAPEDLTFSPDGRVLLFVIGLEIWAFDGTATKVVTTGHSPAWSLDGRSIVFARGYECSPSPYLCAGDDLYTIPAP